MKIITGASMGIGKYLFDRYDNEGELVEGTFLNTEPTRKFNYNANYSYVDVCDYSQVKDWIDSISSVGQGKIELINCAGVKYDSITHKADPYLWEKVIKTNLIGTFNVIRAILPLMREIGYGRIINLSSVVERLGIPGTSAYAASKAGLEGLTKVLAVENGSFGITINNLKLGYFKVGMGYDLTPYVIQNVNERIACHHFGYSEDIFNAVEFLIENDYINGSSLDLNGGLI